MSRFMLRWGVNKDASILHITNFLISYQVMPLEESRPMVRAFHLKGEDVLVEIPDDLDTRFRDTLDSLKFQYEEI